MEPDGSVPHSQMPAICPYILSQINPVSATTSLKIHLNIILPFFSPSILSICKKETQTYRPVVPDVTGEWVLTVSFYFPF
jgi:hypothetical protein